MMEGPGGAPSLMARGGGGEERAVLSPLHLQPSCCVAAMLAPRGTEQPHNCERPVVLSTP